MESHRAHSNTCYWVLGVTQMSIGAANLPGASFPTSIRSAVTISPVSSVKLAHGLGMRLNFIFWMGWPVALFMIVAVMLIGRR